MVALIATASFLSLNSFNELRKGLSEITENDLPIVIAGSSLNQISANLASFGHSILASDSKGTRQAVLLRLKDQVTWLEEIFEELAEAAPPSEDLQRLVLLKSTLVANLHNVAELVSARSINTTQTQSVVRKALELNQQLLQFNERLLTDQEGITLAIHGWTGKFGAGLLLIPTAASIDHPLPLKKISKTFGRYIVQLNRMSSSFPPSLNEKARLLLQQLETLGYGASGIFDLRAYAFYLDDRVQGTVSQNKVIADRFVASASSLTRKLQLRISLRGSELDRESQERSTLFLIMSLLSSIGVILVFFYINRSVIHRLVTLSQTMVYHATGMRKKIATTGNDEITDMTKAFKYFVDVIDKREDELQDAKNLAEKADKAKSQFLAAASHDLRQPLHAIGLFAATLVGLNHNQKTKPVVENIERSIDHMNDLFDSILDYSQLEAGELSPDLKVFNLSPLLAMLETDFSAQAKDKGLILEIHKADYWVRSEALLLDRILRNLLTNAIRYTESGRVSLRLERVGESTVSIIVSDTGRGIPADKQDKIFQEFYRSGAKMEKGLGLGLAIAQQMAKLLESQISVHSAVGKGSDFSINVTEGMPDAKSIDATLKPTSPANATLLTDQLVVVLDDDPQILKATVGLLKRWGCLVISAGNKRAISADVKAQIRQPLAYIVDYQLDHSETGIDVLCTLLEGRQTSRGIIISGNTDPAIEQQAKEAGFTFFSKPLRPAKLASYLRHLARKA